MEKEEKEEEDFGGGGEMYSARSDSALHRLDLEQMHPSASFVPSHALK